MDIYDKEGPQQGADWRSGGSPWPGGLGDDGEVVVESVGGVVSGFD